MSIHVKNEADFSIGVSINHWGDSGSTARHDIDPGETESWDRSDPRGFVLHLQFDGFAHSYMVLANSLIIVTNAFIDIDGKQYPISQN